MEQIGRLKRLRRYPVKSMMGEDLKLAHISQSGVEGDRVFAYVDNKSTNEKFPWMTARQKHEMILFKPRFLDGSSYSRVEVTTPEGEKFTLPDSRFEEYLEKRFGYDLTLKHSEAGIKDMRPLSLLGLHTIRSLQEECRTDLRIERFRANFYVDWNNSKPFFEDELVGRTLQIGKDVIMKIDKKNSRCVIPTLDPRSAEQFPEILENIQRNHQGCFGVYAVPEKGGIVELDDPIYLL